MWRLLIIAPVLVLFACETPVMPLPGTTGKAGELVVVMDDLLWESAIGDTVYAALTEPVYGLPQPEPLFDAVHIRSDAFTKIFQTHRNILICNIGSGFKPAVEVRADVWASPQLVIEITAKDTAEFVRIFKANRLRIAEYFSKKEEERNLNSYRKQPDHDVANALLETFGINMPVPKGFSVISRKENFLWLRHDTKDINQSILVYSEPYTRPNTFSKEGMMTVMDSVCRQSVPGSVPGSFMKTFREYPPAIAETSVANIYASELRGIWNVEGDIMGGPFICYVLLDEPNGRVIYLHGFVFAPAVDKRNLMVQLRSILKGVELL
ncbi:MAG: DUF4837 family protein [Flavobacteriales bacterium]|nr:DUF4837 family protein [Flavobacteriales bacterium]